jgi:hypothetical protein
MFDVWFQADDDNSTSPSTRLQDTSDSIRQANVSKGTNKLIPTHL